MIKTDVSVPENAMMTERMTVADRGLMHDRFCRLVLSGSRIGKAIRPGQFVNILTEPVPRPAPGGEENPLSPAIHGERLLRRPFSLHRLYNVADDRAEMEILFDVRGKGTMRLARSEIGDQLDVMGPCGNPLKLPETVRKVYLVAGGIGVAPMFAIAESLIEKRIDTVLVFGTRDINNIPMWSDETRKGAYPRLVLPDFANLGVDVYIASERPVKGAFTGIVTDLLSWLLDDTPRAANSAVITCGPMAMMSGANKIAASCGMTSYVMMEERMACGYGVCMSCVCKVKDREGGFRYKRTCFDGPIFPGDAIVWDEIQDQR